MFLSRDMGKLVESSLLSLLCEDGPKANREELEGALEKTNMLVKASWHAGILLIPGVY